MRPGQFAPGYKVPAVDMNLLPAGILGYAEATTNQTGISATPADLTGLVVTVTVPAGRRLRITGRSCYRQRTAAGSVTGWIAEGATNLSRWVTQTQAIDAFGMGFGAAVIQPAAGTHTYKLTMSTTGGTVETNATPSGGSQGPAYILVEDIGAA